MLCGCTEHFPSPINVDDGGAGAEAGEDPSDFKEPPLFCSMTCPVTSCAENTTPYVCPAAADWASLPHASTCAAFDGTYPTPVADQVHGHGRRPGDALTYAGPDSTDDPASTILPDGRRVSAAGTQYFTNEASLPGEEPFSVLAVPQTSYALLVDAGYGVHAVEVIDLTEVGGAGSPLVSYGRLPRRPRRSTRAWSSSRRTSCSSRARTASSRG